MLAEARRNRTNPSTLPRRNNGFEDRGSHQTPFASGDKAARRGTRGGERRISDSSFAPRTSFSERAGDDGRRCEVRGANEEVRRHPDPLLHSSFELRTSNFILRHHARGSTFE